MHMKPLCALIFSTVRGSCSASQEGVVGWPQTENKFPPNHLLTHYSQHNEGEKKGGKKEIVG